MNGALLPEAQDFVEEVFIRLERQWDNLDHVPLPFKPVDGGVGRLPTLEDEDHGYSRQGVLRG